VILGGGKGKTFHFPLYNPEVAQEKKKKKKGGIAYRLFKILNGKREGELKKTCRKTTS